MTIAKWLCMVRGILVVVFLTAATALADRTPIFATNQARNSQVQTAPALDSIRDLLRRGQSRDAEREARALLTKVDPDGRIDTLEVAEILDLLSQALRARPPNALSGSIDLVARAVDIREKAQGPGHVDVARSLTNVAILRTLANDPASARPLFERALTIREKALGPNHQLVASSLHNLAGVLMTLHDDAAARLRLERALDIFEKNFGSNSAEFANELYNFANFLRETNDFTEARRSYERALAIQQRLFRPDHPAIGTTLTNLAVVLSTTGDYAAAKRMHEQVVDIWIANFGPNDRRVSMPLNNLALDLTEGGDYAAARVAAERAVAIQKRADGEWHPEVAKRMDTLGIILAEQGDYVGARRLFDRAVEIHVKVLGPEEPEVAFVLSSIGYVLRETGDHEMAKTYYTRALAIREKRLAGDDPLLAASLNDLGTELLEAKEFDRARELFGRALAINEKIFGTGHSSVAMTLNNIGEVLARTHADEKARSVYERALAVGEQAVGRNHPFVGQVLTNIAVLDVRDGNDVEARARLTRALGIQERALGNTHPEVAATLVRLAEVEARSGQADAAVTAALRAENIARDHVQLTARAMSEREALTYAASRDSGLDVMLSLATELPPKVAGLGSRAWDAVVRARALVLDEMGRRFGAIESSSDPELARLNAQLSAARQRLARLTVRGSGESDAEQHRQFLEQARKEKEQAERELADRSLTYRTSESASRAGIEQVAMTMPPDAALVGFVRYRQENFDRAGNAGAARDPVPSYLAFVVSGAGSEPHVVPIGAASVIDDLIADLRKQLTQEGLAPGRSTVTEVAYRRTGENLRRRVWDPLVPYLPRARRVFIVPDGALHLVNFAALPVDATRYLIESGPSIHYLSAERDMLLTDSSNAAAGKMLVVAAPAFEDAAAFTAPASSSPATPVSGGGFGTLRGSQPSCGGFRSMQFDPLPASAREADDIATLWRGAGGEDAIERLLGTAASESVVKTRTSGRRVVHLATHAFFLTERCDSSPIAGAPNPLLLSGLALAGANRRADAPPNGDDGILTGEEIAGLNLKGTDWVVLSGCDTAVGDIRVGEGVLGLRRAFQLAGARTVIMSLWSVEDQAARTWMTHLYRERLAGHRSTVEAVTAADLAVLRERRAKGQSTHPFYWAAFVAVGDWR